MYQISIRNVTIQKFSGCCFGGGFALVPNDIAPAYAGLIFGISNTFATIPGIISPYVVGALTEKVCQLSLHDKKRKVLYLCHLGSK